MKYCTERFFYSKDQNPKNKPRLCHVLFGSRRNMLAQCQVQIQFSMSIVGWSDIILFGVNFKNGYMAAAQV